jgi:hypothetical protein
MALRRKSPFVRNTTVPSRTNRDDVSFDYRKTTTTASVVRILPVSCYRLVPIAAVWCCYYINLLIIPINSFSIPTATNSRAEYLHVFAKNGRGTVRTLSLHSSSLHPHKQLHSRTTSLYSALMSNEQQQQQNTSGIKNINSNENVIDPNIVIQELLSEENNENGSGLRKAVSYLKNDILKNVQQNSIQLSRETWDLIFNTIEERTAFAEENTENLRQIQTNALFPLQSMARQEMTDMYNCLYELGQLQLYGAVSTVDKVITNANDAASVIIASKDRLNTNLKQLPAIGSYTVPPNLMEEILNMPMSALTPQPTNTLLYAGGAFALLEGIVSFATGISLDVLVLATIAFTLIDRIFINGAIIETLYKLFTPGMQQKVTKHEAGHFLIAYLLGCPVEGIVLSAWAAQQDRRFNGRAVSAGTSFFDPILSEQMNTIQPKVTRSSIDRYSIIVMAGIAAEANEYGRADGGYGDEMALVTFLSQFASGRVRSNDSSAAISSTWNSETIKNQARWGALQAVLILRQYKPCYDALVDTLERGGTLGDCIYSIEKAGRDNNLQPLIKPVGYIVDDPSRNYIQWTTSIPTTTTSMTDNNNVQIDSSVSSSSTTSIDNTNNILEQQQKQVPLVTRAPTSEFNPEEATKSLQEYRAEVERKLQEVESKLKELK